MCERVHGKLGRRGLRDFFFALHALWEPVGLISVAAVGKAILPVLLSGISEKGFKLWGRKMASKLTSNFEVL